MEYRDTYNNWLAAKAVGEQAETIYSTMFPAFENVSQDPKYWQVDVDFIFRYDRRYTAELKHDMTAAKSGRIYLEWTQYKPSHNGQGCIQYSQATYLCVAVPLKPFPQLYVFRLADIRQLCNEGKLKKEWTQYGSCYWLPIADIPALGIDYRQYHFNGKPHFFEIF